ncbi:V-type ATP synthase subunit E family protein [Amygdalobacter nucleatus]|uniref:ATP synthase, subunit E n=1 Tax=Amygdalobacter nucleatus TaxID=3029274 RepID=A0A133YG75_9FIRM|nr:hypothetical protein [Amygdalobacter nucleatus]KXB42194.1 hypothetical protein HMPREF1872_00368 [Amygdalobacter nucleatus]MDF0486423.1 hypothetical protein [Amygdalobacter nucleatus]WEG37025.1 hypothetical protein PYS63_00865 [Amygdalobacter nucleatus]
MIQGIDKIKQRLDSDLQAELAELNAATQAEIVKLQDSYAQQILKEQTKEAKWQEQYAAQEEQRLQAKVNLERKRIQLEANQEIIDELLAALLNKLAAMPENEKLDYYLSVLPETTEADSKLILAQNDKELAPKLLSALEKRSASYANVTVEHSDKLVGGVMLQEAEICEDYSFEELVRANQYDLLQIIKQELLK